MKREALYKAKLSAAKAEAKIRARAAAQAFRRYDRVTIEIKLLEEKLENIKLANAKRSD